MTPEFTSSLPPTDRAALAALAHVCPADNLHVVDLPYRLCSWAFDEPLNWAVWPGPGGLRAWAALQTPFWTLDFACHPDHEADLLPEILAWADQRAAAAASGRFGRPCWFVNVFAGQSQRRAALEAAGFSEQTDVGEDPWSLVFLGRPPGQPAPAAPLPGGFRLRPLAGEAEAPAYVDLQRAVFESENMTLDWRRRILACPEYLPDLDLVIEAPDGRLAAFCLAWFDPHGYAGRPCGQIEPLGVHPHFHRRGLGRAILLEAERRLYARGAQTLYVLTDNFRNAAYALYQAGGFRRLQDVLVYRKDCAPLPG